MVVFEEVFEDFYSLWMRDIVGVLADEEIMGARLGGAVSVGAGSKWLDVSEDFESEGPGMVEECVDLKEWDVRGFGERNDDFVGECCLIGIVCEKRGDEVKVFVMTRDENRCSEGSGESL